MNTQKNLFFWLVILAVGFGIVQCTTPTPTPQPTSTFEPIIPTVTVTAVLEGTNTPSPTPMPSATPTLTPVPLPMENMAQATATPPIGSLLASKDFGRFGVSGMPETARAAYKLGVHFRHLLDWHLRKEVALPEGVDYWQMLRIGEKDLPLDWETINQAIKNNPGSVWIVGNEPDVKWQDNVLPEKYIEIYHEAYTKIKSADPTARIAPAGVAQGTPLRLKYLDKILELYQEKYSEKMPADIWTIHAFTLREEKDSWGVDIPPGLDDKTGELYEIDDHDRIDYFQQNIERFRAWMAERGYQDVPLAVTEFGILLPPDYGFPPDVVEKFLRDSYDTLLKMNNATGLPSDRNQLVQYWFWFILEDPTGVYTTGDFYEAKSKKLTPLGDAYIDYITAVRQ